MSPKLWCLSPVERQRLAESRRARNLELVRRLVAVSVVAAVVYLATLCGSLA